MTYQPCGHTFNGYPCSWEDGHPQEFHHNRTMRMTWTSHWPSHKSEPAPAPDSAA